MEKIQSLKSPDFVENFVRIRVKFPMLVKLCVKIVGVLATKKEYKRQKGVLDC